MNSGFIGAPMPVMGGLTRIATYGSLTDVTHTPINIRLPQNFTAIQIVARMSTTQPLGGTMVLQFNSDGSAHYLWADLFSDNSTVVAQGAGTTPDTSARFAVINGIGQGAGTASLVIFDLPFYSDSVAFKSFVSRQFLHDGFMGKYVALCGEWQSTSPITNITLFFGGFDLTVGTQIAVYGQP